MNLTKDLLQLKKKSIEMVPPEIMETMRQETENLSRTDILSHATKEGDSAPDFCLGNQCGEQVTLSTSLKEGPVVLKFFRGDW